MRLAQPGPWCSEREQQKQVTAAVRIEGRRGCVLTSPLAAELLMGAYRFGRHETHGRQPQCEVVPQTDGARAARGGQPIEGRAVTAR
jgi:hypothetical protein